MDNYVLNASANPLANYPHAKKVGAFLFVSGISARRKDNSVEGYYLEEGVVRLDIKEQTKAVIEK
jgi:2-aminomuconate deaminase